MDEISEFSEVCERAVRAAGATIQSWLGRINVRHKGHADLVTEADFASQEVVRTTVLQAFPGHSLLGEEDASAGDMVSRTDYRWIVDPLDGTTNFVHGIPHYAVSLALEHRSQILVGGVYDPNLDEYFSVARGRGSRLNGSPIRTSTVTRLGDAVAGTGFPAQVRPDSPDLLVFNKAIFRCQSVRRTGSASLNLCDLAAGRFDVLWGLSTKIWDIAAGILLVEEAGGVMTSPEGGVVELASGRFLASANRQLHAELLEMVKDSLQK